jgi:hypothetical protein
VLLDFKPHIHPSLVGILDPTPRWSAHMAPPLPPSTAAAGKEQGGAELLAISVRATQVGREEWRG